MREGVIRAVGNPVMKHPQGTMSAERIWFELDPATNDVRVAHAEGAVKVGAVWPDGRTVDGGARRAQFLRVENKILLEGDIELIQMDPSLEAPRRAAGSSAVLDLKTRHVSLKGQGGGVNQAEIRVPLPPKTDKTEKGQVRADPD
jgi:hypothetical protein